MDRSEILIVTHSKDIDALYKIDTSLVERDDLEYEMFSYTEYHSGQLRRFVDSIIEHYHNSEKSIILYTSIDDLIRELSIEIVKGTIDYNRVRAFQFNDDDDYIECKITWMGANISYMDSFKLSQKERYMTASHALSREKRNYFLKL